MKSVLILLALSIGLSAWGQQQIEFVDIYDHVLYSRKIDFIKKLSSSDILKSMSLYPQKYFSPIRHDRIDERLYGDVALKRVGIDENGWLEETYIGPKGKIVDNKFEIDSPLLGLRPDQKLRKNAVFGIEFENVRRISDKSYEADIIYFIHDESIGYYFRRITVESNKNYSRKDSRRVIVKKWIEDIPLSAVNFSVGIDVFARKLILKDSTYGITKVYPIGVGALNLKDHDGMDGSVFSMTHPFRDGSYITKNPKNIHPSLRMSNYRERIEPGYYKGRPFIGIAYPKKGAYVYSLIGLHYQIDASGLKRGFISHGCIRVRDKDLYELEAIVFEGGQAKIPIVVKNSLPHFDYLDHPYSKFDRKYKRILYIADGSEDFWKDIKRYIKENSEFLKSLKKDDPWLIDEGANWVNRYVWCRARGKRTRLRKVRTPDITYTSVLDEDCLTKVVYENSDVKDVIQYSTNKGGFGKDFILPKPHY